MLPNPYQKSVKRKEIKVSDILRNSFNPARLANSGLLMKYTFRSRQDTSVCREKSLESILAVLRRRQSIVFVYAFV